jgi:oxygen-independent coproporphyrinogen-3 oxidase
MIQELLSGNPYQGYVYSYPHKTAYRTFTTPIPLQQLWENEDTNALFLYIHIPFCEMRCGFCNLFTIANPKEDQVSRYLKALSQQARITKDAVGKATFAQMAIGGGTPSFLEVSELEQLFEIVETIGATPAAIPVSFEVSPKTITAEKLQLLHQKGVDRISMGIQSFLEAEVKALGRPQKNREVFQALELIKRQMFPTLNIDLIYGGVEQTISSWLTTIQTAIQFQPEEIYLYPLYVRPLTGLEKLGMDWDNFRLGLYRAGRDYLLSNGYQQISMRMFRSVRVPISPAHYRCQEDGMIGLGAGARSYTSQVHYSTEYAVGRKGVKGILNSYIESPPAEFTGARYGIMLNEDERKRRFLIKSLIHSEGLDLHRYTQLFHTRIWADFPELKALEEQQLAVQTAAGVLRLTPAGLERSDAIGPWLYSFATQQLMQQYELQ